MNTMNDEILERLDTWLDGGCHEPEASQLRADLAQSEELAAQERALRNLFAHLESSRLDVPPDFADRVMAALPRRRPLVSWGVAAAVLVAFGLGGLALLETSGLGGGSLGLFSAIGDFVATSLVAGAGLIGATWSGVGTAVREWLGPSPVNWVIAAAVLLSLGLLLVSLVRRRVPAVQRSRSSRGDDAP